MKIAPSLALSLLLVGCQTSAGKRWDPTVGLATLAVDSYEVRVSDSKFGPQSSEFDASVTEVHFGGTLVVEETGRKEQFAGLKIGSGSADGLEFIQVSGGGHYYFDDGSSVIPYVSIWSIGTYIDPESVGALEVPPMLNFEVGGGAEILLNGQFALFGEAGLSIPIIPAEIGLGVDLEYGGLGARFGIRALLDGLQ